MASEHPRTTMKKLMRESGVFKSQGVIILFMYWHIHRKDGATERHPEECRIAFGIHWSMFLSLGMCCVNVKPLLFACRTYSLMEEGSNNRQWRWCSFSSLLQWCISLWLICVLWFLFSERLWHNPTEHVVETIGLWLCLICTCYCCIAIAAPLKAWTEEIDCGHQQIQTRNIPSLGEGQWVSLLFSLTQEASIGGVFIFMVVLQTVDYPNVKCVFVLYIYVPSPQVEWVLYIIDHPETAHRMQSSSVEFTLTLIHWPLTLIHWPSHAHL